jgi:hypothetical protein
MKIANEVLNVLDEATGNEIKKYMKDKWKTVVKASKVGSSNKFMQIVSISGDIPNEFRKHVVKIAHPNDTKQITSDDVSIGNISKHRVTLKTEQWDALLKKKG